MYNRTICFEKVGADRMATKQFERGEIVFKKGDKVQNIALVTKGCVMLRDSFINMPLENGEVLGALDIEADTYLFDYVVTEDSEIEIFEYDGNIESIEVLANVDENYRYYTVRSMCNQLEGVINLYESLDDITHKLYDYIKNYYDKYKELCNDYMKKPIVSAEIEKLELVEEKRLDERELKYFHSLTYMQEDVAEQFFNEDDDIVSYHVHLAAVLGRDAMALSKVKYDYYIDTFKYLFDKGANNVFAMYSKLALDVAAASGDLTALMQDWDRLYSLIRECKDMEEESLGLEFKYDYSRINDIYNLIRSKSKSEVDETDSKKEKLLMTYTDSQIEKAVAETHDSLKKICTYSAVDNEFAVLFEKYLTVYRGLKDPCSTDNDVRKLRNYITKMFYEIYEKAFFKAEKSAFVPRVIDMFLNYGYMDEKMFTKDQVVSLYYTLDNKYEGDIKVYTIREWLHAIYIGEKQPSKNEFDLDYEENFRELKKTQKFTPEEERAYFEDSEGKVRYEIANMFKSNNRMTSGQLLTFCPVLSGKDFITEVEKMFVSPQKVEEMLRFVLDIDFLAFYREFQYEEPAYRVPRMSVQTEILPDFILMPNVGQRGSMWQEIEGKKRVTPARFIVPSFTAENFQDIMLKLVGAYRWEICRTVQGTYWNDIREKSLTSEYCDYVQFFKKNRDLSEEVKDKVKLQLQKSRNNAKEMFVQDYLLWIKNEALGLSRVNKVVRMILFSYCPFEKKYRDKLAEHPMYTDSMGRYERERLKKLKELNNKFTSIKNSGGEITDILEENISLVRDR